MPEHRIVPGTMIDAYTVLSPYPDSTRGPAWRAITQETGQPVVITVLPTLDAAGQRRFDALAAQLAALRNPGIGSVLSYGRWDQSAYVVSELIDGQSLKDLLAAPAPLPAPAMSLLRQVAFAVDYAHAAGVTHGELRPEAVVVDGKGRAVVTGFGIAALMELGGIGTGRTSAFLAPEQVRSGEASAAADGYSFAALASVVLQKSAPQERAGEIDRVIIRGLSQDPAGRWPSCTAMVEAMVGALQAVPTTPVARRGAGPGIWIVGGIVLLLAIFAALLVINRPPSEPSTEVIAPAAVSLSRSTALPGATVVVSGGNLPVGEAGTVQFESRRQQVGTFTVDQSGSFSVTITVPEGTNAGDHAVLVCWANSCPLQETLTVAAVPPPSASSTSPAPSPTPTATASATPTASVSP